jgi:hypothetical protein
MTWPRGSYVKTTYAEYKSIFNAEIVSKFLIKSRQKSC